jgi:hypothetical protein
MRGRSNALGSEERQLGQARIHVGARHNARLAQKPADAGVGELSGGGCHAERSAASTRLGLDDLHADERDVNATQHTRLRLRSAPLSQRSECAQ